MKRNDPISKLMSHDVITAHVAQKVSEVRASLIEHGIHHLPVVSGNRLVGIISATDLMKLSLSAYGTDQRAVDAMLDSQFSVQDIMVQDVVTLNAHGTVRDAAEALRSGDFHGLPVVDGEGDLVGLVTSTDLINYLLEQY